MSKANQRKRSTPKELRSLTDAEWDIMNAVWEHGPCAAGTVQEALQTTQGWAYSTVKTTMDRMVTKSLLATHSIRNLQMFTAAITRNEAQRFALRRLLSRAFNGALTPMIQCIVDDEEISDIELKQLRTLLNKAKRGSS